MQVTANKNPHGSGTAKSIRHARQGFPSVGRQAIKLNLRIECSIMQIDEIGDSDEFVVIGGTIVAETVDPGGEEAGVGVGAASGGEIRQDAVFAEVRVPEGDVFGDVADAEEAVTGAQEVDAVAVAHERVVEVVDGG